MEKIKTFINSFFRYLLYHLVFWYIALILYVFYTGDAHVFINHFSFIPYNSLYLNTLYPALALAFIFNFLDHVFHDRMMRLFPRAFLLIFRSVFYFILVLGIFILAARPTSDIIKISNLEELKGLFPEFDNNFIRFLAYFYTACILDQLFKNMFKRIGRENYLKWFFGFLNKPREEVRVFMFIDMASSTTIAEKLGHKKFSYLVQDVFHDLSIVDNYQGEVYSYLGDGAIISWTVRQGLLNNNCINAFFAFERVVQRRQRTYKRKYGLVPKFKAGAHIGKIMMLQVGTIRREISYNGDTLNTTARIESMCNEYKQKLLVSGDLFHQLRLKQKYNTKKLGNIQLKGKKQEVELYQVRKKPLNKRPGIFS